MKRQVLCVSFAVRDTDINLAKCWPFILSHGNLLTTLKPAYPFSLKLIIIGDVKLKMLRRVLGKPWVILQFPTSILFMLTVTLQLFDRLELEMNGNQLLSKMLIQSAMVCCHSGAQVSSIMIVVNDANT